MALGGSHMSSTVTPTGTQSVLPPPVQTSNNSNNSSGGGDALQQKGANYFFGFLITFVVLLLVFVGCGIGSRRRYLARRQAAFLGGMDPWGTVRLDGAEQPQPVLFEQRFEEPVVEKRWTQTMPLSVTLLRRVKDEPSADDRPPPGAHDLVAGAPPLNGGIGVEQPTSSAPDITTSSPTPPPPPPPPPRRRATEREHIFPSVSVPSWIPRSESKRRSSQDEKQDVDGDTVDPPEALEITIMIAMPSSSRSASTHDPSHSHPHPHPNPHLPEYQIGVTTLPWHTELNLTSTTPSSS
ncbi:hypothetical protein GALMADRAFT_242504 [Galerina marginata CBS 339.88]|uniref:Uncharacterized protein n=1 Tax=Galerina marginata (strain CBS 339.88) TaxID=685588 RepID=A0A067TAM9_GALM3|nr:hypothetical protein GALMADRAFT_242504 [Galerina marginata CBS 339.88]